MKLKIFFISFIVLFVINKAIANCLLVDDFGNIIGKHYVLKLTPKQIQEIGRTRFLSLNEEQIKIFKKNPKFPKKLHIITPTYDDNLDEMLYGIWNKPGRVGVPSYFVDDYGNCSDFSNSDYYSPEKTIKINLDITGKMFYLDKELTFKEIINKLSNIKDSNYLFIIFRPPITNKNKKIIDRLLTKINKFCSSKKIEFYI